MQAMQPREGLPDHDTATGDVDLVREVLRQARTGLVDRTVVADSVILGAVAGEHLLIVGPPGTAKSEAVRRVTTRLGGRYFEYLLGRFTEPNEIFGPVDLRRLRDGVVEIETTGMLPEAEVAFLDEVFLGSTAILNTLLGVLNERTFRRGATALTCPLRVCVGATNVLPDDPTLAAFADRFLLRVFVDPVEDSRLDELLESGWELGSVDDAAAPIPGALAAIDRLAVAARGCDLEGVRPTLGRAVRRMRAAGIALSDRRAIRSQRLIAAAATLDGRSMATDADLWVLPLVAPTADTQMLAQQALEDLLGRSLNSTLAESSATLSLGPKARAERLRQAGAALLDEFAAHGPDADERLRFEAVLREIDATVDAADMPDALSDVRSRLAAVVR